MDDQFRNLCTMNGAVLRREALTLGYDDKWLSRELRRGSIVRVRHGAYALASTWSQADDAARHMIRTSAVARTAGTDVVLSHITAALVHGAPTWDLPLTDVHLTRRDGRAGRREAGVRQHRSALGEDDVTTVNGWTVTSPARTACDVATLTDVEHTKVIMDDLLHRGLTTHEELVSALKSALHTPGSLGTDLAVRLADGRIESVGESRCHYLFWRFGLPEPIPQLTVHAPDGRCLGDVDFGWPGLQTFVEFDGLGKYGKLLKEDETVEDVLRRERKRESDICAATGWVCIRVTWSDLANPLQLIAKVRSAFSLPMVG